MKTIHYPNVANAHVASLYIIVFLYNNNNKLLYSHISKKHIDSTTVKHK